MNTNKTNEKIMGYTEQELFDCAYDRVMRKLNAKIKPNKINRLAILHRIEDILDTEFKNGVSQ
jgi:hypothetical protein